MEVKKGYKKTEVGELPIDWLLKSLSEIGVFKKGKGISKNQVRSEGIPCLRYGEIYTHHNEYIKKFNSFIDRETANKSQQITFGDLLFTGSGETAEEIGKCVAYLGKEEAYAGGDIIILSPNGYDSKFLGFLLNNKIVVKQKAQFGQGDAVVHIYARNLARVFIPLPPTKQEQSAIAQVLSDTDELISSLEKLIEKKKLIKQGVMQQLLTGKKRLPGFSGKWENKVLGNLIDDIADGGTPSTSNSKYFGGTINWVVIDDIKDEIIETKETLTELGLSRSSSKLWKPGTIILSTGATIGEVGISKIYTATKQGICGIVVKENTYNLFLKYWLQQNKFLLVSKAQGSSIREVRPPTLIKIRISVPSKAEQIAISQVISKLEFEIKLLEQKLNKYKSIKQGMMENLLTGKIRLL
ncbi:MAG: restriction endonuclease subunit S [Stygiobacter sp.]